MENKSIICFAGCDWWYQNRGLFVPQMMSRLAAKHKVVFVNSLGMRIPSLKEDRDALGKIGRKIKSMARYLRKDPCGMYVFTPLSVPFKNPAGKKVNLLFLSLQLSLVKWLLKIKRPIFYIGCPPAWDIIGDTERDMLIYERTDIFEEMPGADKDYILELNRQIIDASDLILYVNRKLMHADQVAPSKGLMLGHGVDYALFSTASKSDYIPEDIRSIPRPIVGFFGDLNKEWCDLELIELIAKTLPNISLVFVGPISSDITKLREYDNMFFLGRKPYQEIPHYGKYFDVAIMPWNQNRWIEYCNPVKTKEYLALGLPVVSIDYPELEPFRDIVYAASDNQSFVEKIKLALNESDEQLAQKRRDRVRNETWQSKVQHLENRIDFLLNPKK